MRKSTHALILAGACGFNMLALQLPFNRTISFAEDSLAISEISDSAMFAEDIDSSAFLENSDSSEYTAEQAEDQFLDSEDGVGTVRFCTQGFDR